MSRTSWVRKQTIRKINEKKKLFLLFCEEKERILFSPIFHSVPGKTISPSMEMKAEKK